MDFELIPATELAFLLHKGTITSEQVVDAFIAKIDDLEEDVGAWTYFDRKYAIDQAREADRVRSEGQPVGVLHGLPVGLKDIIDTGDMPTENGSAIDRGRQPNEDATIVSLLRSAGAVILGKTVTTEFAYFQPGKTRNPHNLEHTPGGSSSGSAAAVASRMVPLAVGTQTNGSMIRPASFCGVVGFKPNRGRISRNGVYSQSNLLDQIGVFANTIEDVALICEALMVFDPEDPLMHPFAKQELRKIASIEPPVSPRLAFVKTPFWEEADDETRRLFLAMKEGMGDSVDEVDLPPIFDDGKEFHRIIMEADFAVSFADKYRRAKDQLSKVLVEAIERGRKIRAKDYNRAVAHIAAFNNELKTIFETYDALITPSTPGPAPFGLDSTGDPIFCTLWTFCGLPAVSLPLLQSASGMPIGVQLVGKMNNDSRLLNTARWVMNQNF